MHTEGQLFFHLEVWAENIEGRKSSLKSSLRGRLLCQELFGVIFLEVHIPFWLTDGEVKA